MDKPFLPLLISFIFGILISNQYQISFIYLFVGLFVGIIILVFSIYKNRSGFYSIILIFILLGMLVTNIKLDSKLLKHTDSRMEYIGIVEEVLSSEDDISKYVVLVQGNLDTGEEIDERIRLNVLGDKSLNYGEKIFFDGVLKKPLDNTNPLLYNQRLNLLSNNIYGSMTINEYSLELLDSPKEFKYRFKEGFHKETNRVFDTYLDKNNSSIIKSMILGNSSYMMEGELQIYRELGLGHILAVSGLHIGIISAFILNILMRFSISRKTSSIITILILFIYGYLIGFPHSMMRGIIMFTLLILTKLLHEHSNPINVLSLSALIILFLNPYALFGLGFILSYTAVLSLYLFSKPIEAFFYPYNGYFAKTLSSILAVNIGILPIQAYYFNYVSLLGLVANLINIPLLSFSLVLSISMFLIEYILPFFNTGLSLILNIILSLEGIIRNIISEFSFLIFNLASPTLASIILYYSGIAILLGLIHVSKLKVGVKNSILVFICLMIVFNFVNISLDDTLELHFIDVGQGDSLLLRKSGRNILIDTGGSLLSNYVGEQITLPYIKKLGINKLDGIIISHFDADHAGALPSLIDNLEIDNIYASYIPEENIYNEIKNNRIAFTQLKEGDKLRVNENLILNTLWPLDTNGLSSNNKSLVLSLNYNEYEILLTGDIEKEAEFMLLDKMASNIDLLKVAHHGSNTSSTDEFLQVIKPKNSIISVGRDNQFNHPSDELINRLSNLNSSIYRTDEMGLIKVKIDKDLKIESFIEQDYENVLESIYGFRWNLTFYLIYYIITRKEIIEYEKSGADLYELC